MKRKLLLALTLGIPLVLFFLWAREAASWRPQKLGVLTPYIEKMIFSPDGRWLILQPSPLEKASQLWDMKSNSLTRELPRAYFYGFSHNNQLLAAVGRVRVVSSTFLRTEPKVVQIEKVATGEAVSGVNVAAGTLRFSQIALRLLDAAFSPDDRQFRVLTPDALHTFDVQTGKSTSQLTMKWSVVWKGERQKEYARFSPDGRLILYSAPYRRRLLDAQTGKLINTFYEGTATLLSPANRVFWSPDSQVVAACNALNSECDLHEVPKGRMANHFFCDLTMEQRSGSGPATEKWVGFGPDSYDYFIFVPSSKTLEHWNVGAHIPFSRLNVAFQWPFAISPDGSFAVSIDKTGQLQRWRLK